MFYGLTFSAFMATKEVKKIERFEKEGEEPGNGILRKIATRAIPHLVYFALYPIPFATHIAPQSFPTCLEQSPNGSKLVLQANLAIAILFGVAERELLNLKLNGQTKRSPSW